VHWGKKKNTKKEKVANQRLKDFLGKIAPLGTREQKLLNLSYQGGGGLAKNWKDSKKGKKKGTSALQKGGD